jgi:hypothetical protein
LTWVAAAAIGKQVEIRFRSIPEMRASYLDGDSTHKARISRIRLYPAVKPEIAQRPTRSSADFAMLIGTDTR